MDRETQFLELLQDCQGRWRAIARAYAPADPEDLFQEILLQIWRSLTTFRGEAASGTWCYRVALNTALNWKRSTRTRRDRLPIHDGYGAERLAALVPAGEPGREPAGELIERMHRVLAEQTPADRAILLLLLDDVSYGEMAEILGTSEATLRVRIHRLKQRIRQRYQGQFDDL